MSESYSPGPGTEPGSLLATALLSQRDLGLSVPVNFVTEPGVSFSAACFANFSYEDDASGDCLSNLLAVGFRRFELDLFWDDGRGLWSFCPVAIPSSVPNAVPSSTSSIGSISISSSLGSLTARAESAPSPTSFGPETPSLSKVNARQATSAGSSKPSTKTSSSFTALSGSPLGGPRSTVSLKPDTPDQPVVPIGRFTCTTTINLSVFTTQLLDYIQRTENTLSAHLLYINFNLHAAQTSPSSPAPEPSTLPGPSQLVGNLFSGNLSSYLYTPPDLTTERANLNGSWYLVNERFRPISGYYETTTNQNDIVSTQDGWPSESYIEFTKSKRLLLGWGNIDPQMAQYNFSGDSAKIFEPAYIENLQTDLAASGGQLSSGCYLLNGTQSVSQVNSSWAISTTIPGFSYPISSSSDLTPLLNLTSNLTSCGISPNLNVTLLNATANTNYIPYRNFTSSTLWSWAPNEPRNTTTSSNQGDTSGSLLRCASTDPSIGRWSVTDCSKKLPAACRSTSRTSSQPYNWTLTTYDISYTFAWQACPSGFEFAAPMTALENSYLTQRIVDGAGSAKGKTGNGGGGDQGETDGYDGRVWVDFNALDTEGCWVMGGPNATCPYNNDVGLNDDMERRYILVPTIAVIIVLVITALTVFVKCAGNRKTRKHTKNRKRIRAENGFVYEGVPS